MEGFVRYLHELWLSRLPRQLAYAICTAAVFELLVWLINLRLRQWLRPALQRDRGAEPAVRAHRMRLLLRPPMIVVRAVLYTLALAIILRIFNFPLRLEVYPIMGLVAAAGIVAAWPLLHDAVRGYLLLYQHAFAPGEEVTILGVRGTVTTVGLTSTRLRTAAGEEVTIANGRITQVVNHTRAAKEPSHQSESSQSGG